MSLDTTVTGNATTASTNPTELNSEVIVNGVASMSGGRVVLEVKPSGWSSDKWAPVSDQTGSYALATPDLALEYRFRAVNCDETVNVYFGP